MKPRRRTILKVIALLAAGAAVNVVVADACSLWSPVTEGTHPKLFIYAYRPLDVPNGDTSEIIDRIDAGVGYIEHVDVLVGSITAELPWDTRREAGWPVISFTGTSLNADEPATIATGFPIPVDWQWLHPRPSRRILVNPLWPGFAINTLFYAAVLWLLFATPFALRRRLRIKRGRCPMCAYPVGTSVVCTECGAAVTPKAVNA